MKEERRIESGEWKVEGLLALSGVSEANAVEARLMSKPTLQTADTLRESSCRGEWYIIIIGRLLREIWNGDETCLGRSLSLPGLTNRSLLMAVAWR